MPSVWKACPLRIQVVGAGRAGLAEERVDERHVVAVADVLGEDLPVDRQLPRLVLDHDEVRVAERHREVVDHLGPEPVGQARRVLAEVDEDEAVDAVARHLDERVVLLAEAEPS
jgi:hypothetical protein